MSDFLKEFLQDEGVITRTVTFNGKAGEVHFKRITAAQKQEMLKGQRVQAGSGKGSTFEIDLAENAHSKALLVLYSVATAEGKQFFSKLADVKAIDAGKLEALYGVASDVNKDEFEADDMGKA
jgi:hypothetical protein